MWWRSAWSLYSAVLAAQRAAPYTQLCVCKALAAADTLQPMPAHPTQTPVSAHAARSSLRRCAAQRAAGLAAPAPANRMPFTHLGCTPCPQPLQTRA